MKKLMDKLVEFEGVHEYAYDAKPFDKSDKDWTIGMFMLI